MDYLVWYFGGREGCLGNWYNPTFREVIQEEKRRLKREVTRLQRDASLSTKQMEVLKKQIPKFAKSQRLEEARQSALDLKQERLRFRRLGILKGNVVKICDKVTEQLGARVIDEGMMKLTKFLCVRMQVMTAERFQESMKKFAEVSMSEEINEEMLNEYFGDQDDDETGTTQDVLGQITNDPAIAEIFEELGVDLTPMSNLPSVPMSELEGTFKGNAKGGAGVAMRDRNK